MSEELDDFEQLLYDLEIASTKNLSQAKLFMYVIARTGKYIVDGLKPKPLTGIPPMFKVNFDKLSDLPEQLQNVVKQVGIMNNEVDMDEDPVKMKLQEIKDKLKKDEKTED